MSGEWIIHRSLVYGEFISAELHRVGGKAVVFAIDTVLNELSGDPLGKKKLFVQKLQDILDEDFEITAEDILKNE